MKTKIGTSFGLAMVLAVSVIATMLAFGLFFPSSARATTASDHVDVTAVVATPGGPGALTNLQISFRTQVDLVAGSGQLLIKFDKNWGLPETIDKDRITITTGQTTGGTSNPVIDPSITTDGTTGDKTITITIGDTEPDTGNQNLFRNQSLTGTNTDAAVHILVFSPLAGITVPIVAAAASDLTNWVEITSTAQTTAEDLTSANAITVLRTISLTSTSGGNGTVITVTGKGFTSGGTATIFLDTDDIFQSTDTVLATSDAAILAGAFTATITVNTTQFSVGGNDINAADGTGSAAARKTWTLNGSVTTSKTEVKRGESVVIKLRQFPNSGAVTSITFGGVPATITAGTTIASSGNSVDVTVTVPTTTPLGTQRVSVTVTGESAARNVNIEIVGAPLTLSPATAVPLQTITISGSGFSASTNISTIFIGADQVPAANIAGNTTVTSDNSGNIVATVKLASDATTRSAGTHTLTVTDASGRTGQATITIPSRSITVDPASSRRASTVSVSGTGFPAKSTVTITYITSSTTTTLGSVTPDSAGIFTATFTVPTGAGIPSSNTVKGISAADGAPSATATHKIPGATVSVAESSAVSGTVITVTGSGFPGFATMTGLTIGGVQAIPTPAPASDIDGVFSSSALVPQLAVGTQAILVTIGGISANTSITVTATPVTPVVTKKDTVVVFVDVIASDNLVRVWRFDNATQSWAFFDPRPAFAAANTLTTASGGDIVWVNVTVETSFQGATLFAGWNLISLD